MQSAPRLMDGILPKNATPYERTLAANVDRLLDVDAERIRDLWNPLACSEEDLPYLAWALSVDLWKPDWPLSKKRMVCASALDDHRHKGTLYLIERYLGYVGSKLVRAVVPPARAYATGGFKDHESRLSWLAGLPQIRIYPFLKTRTPPKARAFCRSEGRTIPSFFKDKSRGSASFMQTSEGSILSGRQATFVKDGIEVPAAYSVLAENSAGSLPERISISGSGRAYFYGVSRYGRAFMQDSRAEDNVVSIRLTDGNAQRFAVASGSRVTDVEPLRVVTTRIAPTGRGFFGPVQRQRFMLSSEAGRLVYDQVSILDPTIPLLDLRKKTKFFWGFARYGIAPFTAELAIEVPITRPRSRYGKFYTGFMQKADLAPLKEALAAIGAAKSLRDTILVDTEIYRTVQLSDELFLGGFTLGQTHKIQ